MKKGYNEVIESTNSFIGGLNAHWESVLKEYVDIMKGIDENGNEIGWMLNSHNEKYEAVKCIVLLESGYTCPISEHSICSLNSLHIVRPKDTAKDPRPYVRLSTSSVAGNIGAGKDFEEQVNIYNDALRENSALAYIYMRHAIIGYWVF